MKKAGQIIISVFVLFTLFVIGSKAVERYGQSETEIPQNIVADSKSHHILVTYFHGNVRCESCRKLENYTKTMLAGAFQEELKSGLIEFRTVNVDKPENEKYIDKYKLTTKQVIVSEFDNGIEKRWKDLDRIWSLLDDEEGFKMYEEMEIRGWLNEVKK
ncbi:MAG TPA: nitrophenyl compound nitroreductase subunit ArsF family protein [bacterium]|nr:nitrophenyl compound nitroreductase subunit ArsF family protein [bacterium]HPS30570.1 nitrophenyl compound nitroreductase subunit ArsF family protein [bacterium]